MKSQYLVQVFFISPDVAGAYFLYAFVSAIYAVNWVGFNLLGILPLAFLVMLFILALMVIGLITPIAMVIHQNNNLQNQNRIT